MVRLKEEFFNNTETFKSSKSDGKVTVRKLTGAKNYQTETRVHHKNGSLVTRELHLYKTCSKLTM